MSTTADRKIALITGSSRGLGRNMALHLARQGVDVVITYRSHRDEAEAAAAEVIAEGARALVLQLDVADSTGFAGFADALKSALGQQWQRDRFDYLVNNAGIGIHAAFADTTEAQFDELFRIHLKAPFFLTQALLPLIADGGRILNVSSGLARFSLPGFAAYAAMKGCVEVLTRYMARELGERRITVNTLAPGAIETDSHAAPEQLTVALRKSGRSALRICVRSLLCRAIPVCECFEAFRAARRRKRL